MPGRSHSQSFDASFEKMKVGEDPDFKPLKKAWTMLNTPTYEVPKRIEFHEKDILYRRHFGGQAVPLGRMLKKGIMSLEGMEGSWLKDRSGSFSQKDQCIIVVDCFSTGAMVAHEALEQGFKVIRIDSFDNPDLAAMVASNCRSDYQHFFTFEASPNLSYDSSLTLMQQKIEATGLNVVSVIAGAETGVELADRLSERLSRTNNKVLTNGSSDTENRRNKYLMGEKVRSAGICAVMQKRATTWGEIKNFLETWKPSPYNVIVKPMESAGSDDVTLCHSEDDVKAAFGNIMGKVNSLGCVNEGVLVQEYLQGVEYVVDTVSLNGVHKCVALWEYDRRPTNGAGFVLHGQRLMTATEEHAKDLVEYQFKVLDALNIKNGPGHGEVKWFNGEPCLVEVGSRCHGAEGMWIPVAEEVYGYDQVGATLDCYCNSQRFLDNKVYPVCPLERKSHGCAKMLISHVRGDFLNFNEEKMAEVKAMSSFRAIELFLKPGDKIKPTIDCFTWAGCVLMANPSKTALEKDYARIEEMCLNGELYDYEKIGGEGEEKKKAVCVVDPFTTGAVLAAEISNRGYKIICVYSASLKELENLVSLVPKGLELHFDAIIGQKDGFSEEMAAVYTAGEVLKVAQESNFDVVACLAGAETGVQLADRVAEKLSLRGNGSEGTEARRNKYLMCEKLRAFVNPAAPDVPTRAVMQCKADKYEGVVSDWLKEWNPDPFKVIVKPVESAGSDDVKLCQSAAEVKEHCEHIVGKMNGLGFQNDGVLVQEFLEGKEYVCDSVSRDGVLKCVGLWEYHKEAVNGHSAPLVYFGQKTLVPEEEENEDELKAVIAYQRVVLEALGIMNGPAHAEIKMVKGEPCLVEVGARCHGAEGCWRAVTIESHGFDQVTSTADAYLDEAAWEKLPSVPQPHKAYPRVIFIVSFESGILKECNKAMVEEIMNFKSFRDMELFVEEGKQVEPTTDCFTFVGNVRLCHEKEAVVQAEYDRIREMEKTGFLVFE
ncbi:hypothetical protein TrST_g13618 [Triparma strigata]|uniref:ATP-grasp domain-containing protein n=1 Tax=Triparma strigata TaxID=1606541 RepID=A0A9W7BY58_9STRA|nr:hypothetical protein TrST_g13618 [Triparma strigata]